MKLFGGSKNSKHAGNHVHQALHTDQDETRAVEPDREAGASGQESEAPWWDGQNISGDRDGQRPEMGGTRENGTVFDGSAFDDDGGFDDDLADDEEDYGRGFPTWAKIIIVVVSVLLVLFLAALIWFKSAKLPEQTQTLNPVGGSQSGAGSTGNTGTGSAANTDTNRNPDKTQTTPSDGGEDKEDEVKPTTGRNDKMYTFLVAGKDKVGSNTDVLMVACLDTENYTLNVVSIPRDTYVNTTYKNHRVNSVYGVGGADGLMSHIGDIMGYKPDFYAVVDLDAFIKLVDGIGGVDYDVPRNMSYDDPAQDLHIHFTKGMTHMTGQKAMEYCRYRSGYADADIGRIDAQHDFLMEAAKQILAKKDSISVTTIIDIFLSDVKTDLTLENCTALASELLKLDAENIKFFTIPANYNDSVHGSGYVTIHIDEWVEMLNEYFDPFYDEITTAHLNVAGRDSNGNFYSTTGTLY